MRDNFHSLSSTTLGYGLGVILLLIVGLAIRIAGWLDTGLEKRKSKPSPLKNGDDTMEKKLSSSWPPVEPRQDFDWEKTEPVKFRPFKPVYNITMKLEKCSFQDWIEMDRTYLTRLLIRQRTIAAGEELNIAFNPRSHAAVCELYTLLLETYLPARYPSMFTILKGKDSNNESSLFHNRVTSQSHPLSPPTSTADALRNLGNTIEDELLLLLPSPDGDGYTLEAFCITCYPSGFDTSNKLSRKLRDIHEHVPSYAAKIEKSMDRYFDRIRACEIVRRNNWSVMEEDNMGSTDAHLYTKDAEKARWQDSGKEGERNEMEGLDVDATGYVMKSERQVLFRMPETGAIVFMFKTYAYPLSSIKEEGSGPDFADAIEGLAKGNAAGMVRYKRAVVWGDKVIQYMRS